MQYVGTTDAVNATLSYFAVVSDSNGGAVINSNQTVLWTSPSTWSDAGVIALQSTWSLYPQILSWDVNASLVYFDQQFAFALEEHDSVGDNYTNAVVVFGNGTYAGSWSAWETILEKSYLVYNEDLIGSATGSIIGITPHEWLDGEIHYQTVAKDSSLNNVFTTNGETKWLTTSTWTDEGLISTLSEVFIQDILNWNASGSFKYGNNAYSLYVLEKDLSSTSTVNSTSTNSSNLYAFADGGYDLSGWNDW